MIGESRADGTENCPESVLADQLGSGAALQFFWRPGVRAKKSGREPQDEAAH